MVDEVDEESPDDAVTDVNPVTEDDVDGPENADEWKAPSREEWSQVQAKLRKSNQDAQHHRAEARKLREQGESESEQKVREAQEKAETDAEGRWKPITVRMAARSALAQAGLIGKPDRLLKLIDSGSVEVDDDGEVSGLTEQVRQIKADYPELFVKRGSSRVDGADRGSDSATGGMSATTRRLLAQANQNI